MPKTKEHETPEEKAKRKAEEAQAQLDLAAILKTPAGVRFFKRFFDRAFVFRQVMTGNSWTFFNDGRRSLGNELLHEVLNVRPDLIQKLIIREEMKHERTSGTERSG